MIGDLHMDRVRRPALRHMTPNTIPRSGMKPGVNLFRNDSGVASLAHGGFPLHAVGIVARSAGELSLALPETRRFQQAIRCAGKLHAIVAFPCAIEVQDVVRQRLSWTIGENSAIIALERSRK